MVTKKVDDGFGLELELRPKSYVDVLIGTRRVVSHVDGGRFGSGWSSRCRDEDAAKNKGWCCKGLV